MKAKTYQKQFQERSKKKKIRNLAEKVVFFPGHTMSSIKENENHDHLKLLHPSLPVSE